MSELYTDTLPLQTVRVTFFLLLTENKNCESTKTGRRLLKVREMNTTLRFS